LLLINYIARDLARRRSNVSWPRFETGSLSPDDCLAETDLLGRQ